MVARWAHSASKSSRVAPEPAQRGPGPRRRTAAAAPAAAHGGGSRAPIRTVVKMDASVLISRRKSWAANRPSPVARAGVRGGGDRDATFDQLGEHPGDQRGVAGVVEFEFVDAHHGVLAEQVDALDETEDAGQLGQLAERGEGLGVLGRLGQAPVGRGEQVGLAHPEPAVEVEPTPGSGSRFPNSFLRPARRRTASSQKPRHERTAAAWVGSAGSGR